MSFVFNQPFTQPPSAWNNPMVSTESAPAWLTGDVPTEPGIRQPLPMRQMTPAELAEQELEDEREQIRMWIDSARRSVDPSQHNAEHEAAVAEHIAYLESKLAAVGKS